MLESRTHNRKVVGSSLGPAGIVGGGGSCVNSKQTGIEQTVCMTSDSPLQHKQVTLNIDLVGDIKYLSRADLWLGPPTEAAGEVAGHARASEPERLPAWGGSAGPGETSAQRGPAARLAHPAAQSHGVREGEQGQRAGDPATRPHGMTRLITSAALSFSCLCTFCVSGAEAVGVEESN